jgi:lysine-arginine-ornithine-binding protein
MLKKMIASVLVGSLLATISTLASAQETLRIAVEGAYPPFNMQDADGTLKGFDVDIAKALCDEMKVQCVIVAQDWDGMIPGLLTKKYDAIISSMSITEPRQKVIAFSRSYYVTNGVVVKRKDNKDITGNSPAELKGQVIASQSASIYSALLESQYGGSTVKLYATADEAFADLSAGRVAVVFADKIAALQWLDHSSQNCCELIGPDISDPKIIGEGAGIGLRKSDDALRNRFNIAIDAIVKDGTYKQINDKYFPFNVF